MNPEQPYQTAPKLTPPSSSSPADLRQPVPLIGKILGILILAVFLLMVYMTVVKNPAETASNNFMGYITDGKVDEAIKLTNAAISDSDRSFFNSAATAVKGSSKLIDSGKQDKKHYFLYELSSDTSKYARTILEEQSSKWVIVSFVHNKEKLKLFPDTSTTESSSAETTPAGSNCLVAQDFDTLFRQINGSAATLGTLDYSKPTNPYTNNVHFNPDTLDFSTPATLNQGVIDAFAAFGKQYKNKAFTINVKGSVGTTKQADLDFARQRSEKIQALLIAGGAPSDKIIIDSPGSVGDYGTNDSVSKQTARNVVLKINPTCSQSPETGR